MLNTDVIELLLLTRDETLRPKLLEIAGTERRVELVASADEARAVVARRPIGVFILDTASVDEDLGDFLDAIAGYDPQLATIAIGDRDEGDLLMRLSSSGHLYRFLYKPLSYGQVRRALEAAVSHYASGPDTSSDVSARVQTGKLRTAEKRSLPMQPVLIGTAVAGLALVVTGIFSLSGNEEDAAPVVAARPSVEDSATADFDEATLLVNAFDSVPAPDGSMQAHQLTGALPPVKAITPAAATAGASNSIQNNEANVVAAGAAADNKAAATRTQPAQTKRQTPGKVGQTGQSVEQATVAAAKSPAQPLTQAPSITAESERPAGPTPVTTGKNPGLSLTQALNDAAESDRRARQSSVASGKSPAQSLAQAQSSTAESARPAGPTPVATAKSPDQLLTQAKNTDPQPGVSSGQHSLAPDGSATPAGLPRNARSTTNSRSQTPGSNLAAAQEQTASIANGSAAATTGTKASAGNKAALVPDSQETRAADALPPATGAASTVASNTNSPPNSNADTGARPESAATAPGNAALSRARNRINSGALLSPEGDSALDHLNDAIAAGAAGNAIAALRSTLADALITSAHTLIADGDPASAAVLLDEAGALGAPQDSLDAALSTLQWAEQAMAAKQLRTRFEAALADGRLLSPPDDNAFELLQAFSAERGPADEQVSAARARLAEALSSEAETAARSDEAEAARTLADAAREAGASSERLASVDQALQSAASLSPGDTLETKTTVASTDLVRRRYVPPTYPRRAALRGIEGYVHLEFVVSEDGNPREIVVKDSKPRRTFERAAKAALEQWEYEPLVEDGKTIERRAEVNILFALDSD